MTSAQGDGQRLQFRVETVAENLAVPWAIAFAPAGRMRLLQGQYGRLREVAEGPDGALYFSTSNRDGRGKPMSNDDRLLRLAPVK